MWKPLKGPLRDWPLAICDPATVSQASDVIAIDNIVEGEQVENLGLHHSPKQRWMYLSDQMPNELLVFRQADSDGNTGNYFTIF